MSIPSVNLRVRRREAAESLTREASHKLKITHSQCTKKLFQERTTGGLLMHSVAGISYQSQYRLFHLQKAITTQSRQGEQSNEGVMGKGYFHVAAACLLVLSLQMSIAISDSGTESSYARSRKKCLIPETQASSEHDSDAAGTSQSSRKTHITRNEWPGVPSVLILE
ncbi:hypothetical protein NQZ68_017952 [Dissostichus eleginoides]|nr:hypothetical protein NQZ68_017952 [Dissostichus eleginoides]